MMHLSPSRFNRRRGAVTAQVAICMALLLCVAALTLDGGMMMAEQQHAQAAADAAALAAAVDLANNFYSLTALSPDGGTSAKSNAVNAAAANYGYSGTYTTSGNVSTFTVGSTTCSVTVNIPPTSGNFTSFANHPGCVEVIVTYNQPRSISGINIGGSTIVGTGNIPVTARSVARGLPTGPGFGSLLLLGWNNGATLQNLSPALSITGGSLHTAGTITVDSNANSGLGAVRTTGATSILSDTSIHLVGTEASGSKVYAPTSGSTTAVKVSDSADYMADPLSGHVTVPDATALGLTEQGTGGAGQFSATTRMSPGIYTGGVKVSNSGVTMKTGVYIIKQGDFTVSSGISVSSETGGVLIYLTGYNGSNYSRFTMSANSSATLAPLSGNASYPNPNQLAIFQDNTAPVNAVTVNQWQFTSVTALNVSGLIYAPSASLVASGTTTINLGDSMIANQLALSGSATFKMPKSLIPLVAGTNVILVE